MKLSSLTIVGILIAALAVVATPIAKADSLPPGDPRIQVGGAMIDDPASIITTSFSLSSPSGTSPLDPANPNSSACELMQGPFQTESPDCQFINGITVSGKGQVIDSLVFDLPTVAPNDPSHLLTCGGISGTVTVFSDCSILPDGNGGSVVFFTGGTIPWNTIFTIGFDGFDPGTTTSATAQLPEPGTLLLLAIGLIALVGAGLKRSPARAQ